MSDQQNQTWFCQPLQNNNEKCGVQQMQSPPSWRFLLSYAVTTVMHCPWYDSVPTFRSAGGQNCPFYYNRPRFIRTSYYVDLPYIHWAVLIWEPWEASFRYDRLDFIVRRYSVRFVTRAFGQSYSDRLSH